MSRRIQNEVYTLSIPGPTDSGAAYFKMRIPKSLIDLVENKGLKKASEKVRKLSFLIPKKYKDDLLKATYALQKQYQADKNNTLLLIYQSFGQAISNSIRRGGEAFTVIDNLNNPGGPTIVFNGRAAGLRRFASRTGRLANSVRIDLDRSAKDVPTLKVTFGPVLSTGVPSPDRVQSPFTSEYAPIRKNFTLDSPISTGSTNVVGSIEGGGRLQSHPSTKGVFVGLGNSTMVSGFRPFEGAIKSGYDDILNFAKRKLQMLANEYEENFEEIYARFKAIVDLDKAPKETGKKTLPTSEIEGMLSRVTGALSILSDLSSTVAAMSKGVKKTKNKIRTEYRIIEGKLSDKVSSVSDIQNSVVELIKRVDEQVDYSKLDEIIKEQKAFLQGKKAKGKKEKLKEVPIKNLASDLLADSSLDVGIRDYFRSYFASKVKTEINQSPLLASAVKPSEFKNSLDTFLTSFNINKDANSKDLEKVLFKNVFDYLNKNIKGTVTLFNKDVILDEIKELLSPSNIRKHLYRTLSDNYEKMATDFSKALIGSLDQVTSPVRGSKSGSLKDMGVFIKDLEADYRDLQVARIFKAAREGDLEIFETKQGVAASFNPSFIKQAKALAAFSDVFTLFNPVMPDVVAFSVPKEFKAASTGTRSVSRFFNDIIISKKSLKAQGSQIHSTVQITLDPTFVINYVLDRDSKKGVLSSNTSIRKSFLASAYRDPDVKRVFNNIFLDFLLHTGFIEFKDNALNIPAGLNSAQSQKISFIKDLYQKHFAGVNAGDVGDIEKPSTELSSTQAKFFDKYQRAAAEFYGISSALGVAYKERGKSIFDGASSTEAYSYLTKFNSSTKKVSIKSSKKILDFTSESSMVGIIASLAFKSSKPYGRSFLKKYKEYQRSAKEEIISDNSSIVENYSKYAARLKELNKYLEKNRNRYLNSFEVTRDTAGAITDIVYAPLKSFAATAFKKEFMAILRSDRELMEIITNSFVSYYIKQTKTNSKGYKIAGKLSDYLPRFDKIGNLISRSELSRILNDHGFTDFSIISTRGFYGVKGYGKPDLSFVVRVPMFDELRATSQGEFNDLIKSIKEKSKNLPPDVDISKQDIANRLKETRDRLGSNRFLQDLDNDLATLRKQIKLVNQISKSFSFDVLLRNKNNFINKTSAHIEKTISEALFGKPGSRGFVDRFIDDLLRKSKTNVKAGINKSFINNRLIYQYEKALKNFKEDIDISGPPKNVKQARDFLDSLEGSLASVYGALKPLTFSNPSDEKVLKSIVTNVDKSLKGISTLRNSIKDSETILSDEVKQFNSKNFSVVVEGIDKILKGCTKLEALTKDASFKITKDTLSFLKDATPAKFKKLEMDLSSTSNTLSYYLDNLISVLNSMENKSRKTLNSKERESLSEAYYSVNGFVPEYVDSPKTFFGNIRRDIEYFENMSAAITSGGFSKFSTQRLVSLRSLELSASKLSAEKAPSNIREQIKAIENQILKFDQDRSQIEFSFIKKARSRIEEVSPGFFDKGDSNDVDIGALSKTFEKLIKPIFDGR